MAHFIGQLVKEDWNENDLFPTIQKDNPLIKGLSSIGIQTQEGNFVFLNGESFEIGKTGCLQFNNVYVTSVSIKKRSGLPLTSLEPIIIDYIGVDTEGEL